MRSKIIASLLLAVGVALIPAIASAAPGSPHSEESDGCDHGNTGKPCKDDPSSNGKDCDVHGNHGGVNEDHCSDETTTTTVPVVVVPPVDDTTTTTVPAPVPVPVVIVDATTTTVPAPVAAPVPVVAVDPAPVAPVAPVAPAAEVLGVTLAAQPVAAPAAPLSELPHTGSSGLFLGLLGLALLSGGAGIRGLVRQ